MTDLSTRAVHITLARELSEALEQIRSGIPLQVDVGIARVRRVRNALTEEQPAAPLRKLAIVGRYEDSPSLRPSEEQIQSRYLDRTPEPDPACLAEQEREQYEAASHDDANKPGASSPWERGE